MIEIDEWINCFLKALRSNFEKQIWFVGLQGSYARNEATETSDIDVVVILNKLSVSDIQTYNNMLDTLPYRELICGFLSGKDELINWETSDLFQFYYDTEPIKGSLDELLFYIDDISVSRAIKTGVCNIYHSCVHNMLYEKSEKILYSLYKSAVFVVQAICFRQTGKYTKHLKDLLDIVGSEEKTIIQIFLNLKSGDFIEFEKMSEILFYWVQSWIQQ